MIWALFCITLLAQSSLEQAVTLARAGRYAEARRALTGVTEPAELSQRIAFHRLRAAIASGLGEATAAANEMRAALALSPADSSLLLGTAMAELQARQLDDALQHARMAEKSATAEAILGDIQEKCGNYMDAATAYQTAVELAPDQEQYRIAFGLELIRHQSFRPAIDLLRESAVLFPKSAKIRTLLGIAQYADGNLKEGVAALEDAIATDPKFEAAYSSLAQIVLQSSAAPAPRTVKLLCGWNALVCSALRLREARESGDSALEKQAIARLKRAPPESVVGRCELARAYEWTDQLASARTEMEACVRLNPIPQNHYRLGLLYKKMGLTELARQEMQIRNEILQKMSEETALGLNALQSFSYSAK